MRAKINHHKAAALNRDNFNCLQVLATAAPKLRKAILKNSNKSLIDAISECCKNVLKGKRGDESSIKHLRRYRNHIRVVANKKIPVKKRKSIINQHGGFLQYLLPLAISTLSSILSKQ